MGGWEDRELQIQLISIKKLLSKIISLSKKEKQKIN
jgi:hypothetical protein